MTRLKSVVAECIIADFAKLYKAIFQQTHLWRNKRFAETLTKNVFAFMRERSKLDIKCATHFSGEIQR